MATETSWNSEHFSRFSAKPNFRVEIWANLGQLWQSPRFGKVRPNLAEMRRIRPKSLKVEQMLAGFGPNPTGIAPTRHVWAKFGRIRAEFTQSWPHVGQIRSKFGRHRHNLANFGQHSANIGPISAQIAQTWPHHLVQVRPKSPKLGKM